MEYICESGSIVGETDFDEELVPSSSESERKISTSSSSKTDGKSVESSIKIDVVSVERSLLVVSTSGSKKNPSPRSEPSKNPNERKMSSVSLVGKESLSKPNVSFSE